MPDKLVFDIPHKGDITIRQLLAHRAGVFDVTNQSLPDSINASYAGQYYLDYLQGLFGKNNNFTPQQMLEPIAMHKLKYFKSLTEETGIPYQTLINLYLRDCAIHHRKLQMQWLSQT